jgi:hypothetical protein
MPEYMGMAKFGSLARDESREDSDVDVILFVRPDTSVKNQVTQPSERLEGSLRGTYFFDGITGVNYEAELLSHLKKEGIDKADFDIVPINEEIVANNTALLLEEVGNSKRLPAIPRNIRQLFHSPIDIEDLRPYMEQVLNAFKDHPNGEKAWNAIRHMVTGYEQGREGDFGPLKHRYLPQTLEEALDYYLKNEG